SLRRRGRQDVQFCAATKARTSDSRAAVSPLTAWNLGDDGVVSYRCTACRPADIIANDRPARSPELEVGMSTRLLTGSFVALITPFNKDGSVDFGAFRTLLKFQEDHGTAAVLIMGSTGETSMLTPEEKKQIIVETAKMKTAGMPIFFGCTGNNTEATIANVRFAKDNGADGPILAPPPYIS